jgi:hypothetical protein
MIVESGLRLMAYELDLKEVADGDGGA